MPYLITTTLPGGDPEVRVTEASVAVATLDDAYIYAQNAADHFSEEMLPPFPESGGMVGPLPDGTIIEVERVDFQVIWEAAWSTLFPGADPDSQQTTSRSKVFAAYNAAQEARV